MRLALSLARGQLGRTAPNPTVGCVIVRDGSVVGDGATHDGGRPHAEEVALALAGRLAKGASAFVTLEPCALRSSGGLSCAERLIEAGLRRVVVAAQDPHAKARGVGLARLRAAGVLVEQGLGQAEAVAVNAGFFKVVRSGMPLLLESDDATSFDQELREAPGGDVMTALRRLAEAGVTRAFVRTGSALAEAARRAGQLDADPLAGFPLRSDERSSPDHEPE